LSGDGGGLTLDVANSGSADLDVKIAMRDMSLTRFSCTVSSPLLEELRKPSVEDWDLPDSTGAIVAGYMEQFSNEDANRAARLMALKGAGMLVWNRAPRNFTDAYRKLLAADKKPATIQITSDEPYMPWEIADPDDGDERPLGVRHTIARWFTGSSGLRGTGVPAADARVAVPLSDPPPRQLASGPAEAKLVRDALSGEDLRATNAAVIRDQLATWTGTVLHFACHGTAGPTTELKLDGEELLSDLHVRAMTGLRKTWAASAPVVFLNACGAGASAPSLRGAGGVTEAWTTVGAGAVIAPLWSVEDEVAHQVACEFYGRIEAEPHRAYAEIVRDIRARANEREHDSYAAYAYFGSPWASAG
jgi:hypothetical protein